MFFLCLMKDNIRRERTKNKEEKVEECVEKMREHSPPVAAELF